MCISSTLHGALCLHIVSRDEDKLVEGKNRQDMIWGEKWKKVMLPLYSFIHTDRYAKSPVEHGAPKENMESYRNTALNSLWDSIEKRCFTQASLKDKQSRTTQSPILLDTCGNLKVNGQVDLTKGGPHHIAMGTTKGWKQSGQTTGTFL